MKQRQSSILRLASSLVVVSILIIGAIVVNRIEDVRLARELSAVGEDIPVYQPQGEQEALTNAASGDASWQIAEKMTAGRETETEQEQTGASVDTAQYNAARQAAEDTKLAGSNAFWEKSDLEDDADGQDAQSETLGASETGTQNGAAGTPETGAQAETAESAKSEDAQEAVAVRHTQAGYVIKEGDTLAAICSRYYGTMDRIADVCEANGIKDANLILPGQRIVLP